MHRYSALFLEVKTLIINTSLLFITFKLKSYLNKIQKYTKTRIILKPELY